MNLAVKLARLGLMSVVLGCVGRAGPVTFDLQGVDFTDGAAGTGYFVFDPNLTSFSDWNVVTASGSGFPGFDYTPLDSVASTGSVGCLVDFVNASRSLCLNPDSPLISGASPALLPTSFESSDSGQRFVFAGTLSDPPPNPGGSVPEPGTSSFVGFGSLGILGVMIRRQLRGRQP